LTLQSFNFYEMKPRIFAASAILSLLIFGNIITMAQDNPQLQITEINNAPESSLEWIEVWNNTQSPLFLNKLKFIENDTRHNITHETRTTIEPNEIFIIANNANLMTDIPAQQLFDSSWQTLSLEGESIALEYDNTITDQIMYPNTSASTSAQSLHRIDSTTFTLASISPLINGITSPIQLDTPTPILSPPTFALITEVSPNSANDFVELYFAPTPGTELNLQNWHLIDDNTFYTFTEQIISTPTYLSVDAPFTKTNENIILLDAEDNIIDAVCWHNSQPSQTELNEKENLITANAWQGNCLDSDQIATNTSIGRTSFFDTNTTSDWEYFSHPTYNKPNEYKNSAPTAIIKIQSGKAVEHEKTKLNLTGIESSDPDNDQLSYSWVLNQTPWSEKANPSELVITEIGTHQIQLIVTDPSGASSNASIYIQILPPLPITKAPECKPIAQSISATPAPPIVTTVQDTSWWSQISINSFLANPKGTDTNNEWIKLTNNSAQTITLNNWKLDDKEGGSTPYKIPDLQITSGQTISISSAESHLSLNNNGDEVRLFTPDNQLAAAISYDIATDDQILPATEDETETNTTNNASPKITPIQTKLTTSATTTPTSNTATTKTSKTKFTNGSTGTDLKITEVFPNPKGTDTNNEWLELFNPTQATINIGNWKLMVNSHEYILTDTINILPYTYLKLDQSNVKFSLTNSDTTIQLLNFENQLADTLTYSKTKEAESYALLTDTRITDGTKTWKWTTYLSPGQPNPELIEINGVIDSKGFAQNQLIINAGSIQEQIVQFATDQISQEQLNLLNSNPQIKLIALRTNNKLNLEEILDLKPITNASTNKPNYILPILIFCILLSPLLYKPSRNWLIQKFKLANTQLSN